MAAAVAIQPLAPRSGPMAFNQQQPRTSKVAFSCMIHVPSTKNDCFLVVTSSRGRRERPCMYYIYIASACQASILTTPQVTGVVDERASVYYKTHYLAFCVNSTSKIAPLSRPLNLESER